LHYSLSNKHTDVYEYSTSLIGYTQRILNYSEIVCNVSWKTYAFCVCFCVF